MKRQVFAVAFVLTCSLWASAQSAAAEDFLTIGSEAPPLDIEHWVQDGQGKFKPVTKFEPGKVYVVEFWATWCYPCIMSMPHLAETQQQYAAQGVQLISVSDEDLDTVKTFLKRPVVDPEAEEESTADADGTPQTYNELTSAYCLTADPDRSVYEAYMDAAFQAGIPTAFIVGKKGTVEWIGHPMEMDGPLEAIVANKWDTQKFAAEFRPSQITALVRKEATPLLQKLDYDGALKIIDDQLKQYPKSFDLRNLKLQVLLVAKRMDAAQSLLGEIFSELADSPEEVNGLAWNIYEMSMQSGEQLSSLAKVAIEPTEKAIEKAGAEQKASLMDTLAHLIFLQGDVDKALEIEQAALKIAPAEEREFMEAFLKELQEAKQKQAEENNPPSGK